MKGIIYLRGNRHKRLHTGILKDSKENHKPERHRQVPDRSEIESTPLHSTDMTLPAGEVGNIVFRSEVSVEEEHRQSAEEGEERDDGADP